MKKIFALILAFALMIPAFAETATPATPTEAEIEYFTLEGIVTEITEEYFLLDNIDLGAVQVNYDEETYFTNEIPFACGQYAIVTYNGQMTRSLPAQVYAIAVNVSRMIGDVITTDAENNAVTILTELYGEVIVHLPETDSAENYIEGDKIMVYHSGAMMMSLPPQIGAALVMKVYTVNGEITELGEEYVLVSEGEMLYQVNFSEDTLITAPSVEMAVGQSVTVLFNGMTTRSIPAQITAIEFIVNTVSSEE